MTTAINDVYEAARDYHRIGLPITLCNGKKPIPQGWPSKRWTEREIDSEFRKRGPLNVGTCLGAAAKLIDIEYDSPDGGDALNELFGGDVPVTPTFKSPRGEHRIFAWHQRLEAVGKASIHVGRLEVRLGAGGKGAQTLLPPSTTDGR